MSSGSQDADVEAPPPPSVSESQRARIRARLFARAPPTSEPPLVGGKYRLVSLLGEGGMGAVWEAEHVFVGKRFALKVLKGRRGLDTEARRRFLREARAASSVGHENIVEVTDAGETDDGTPYVVMELLRGATLATVIEESGRLPWRRARALLVQLASALARAHDNKIVHRDLKPENVMVVSRDGAAEVCKVVDFGLAKVLGDDASSFSRSGQVFGTPTTMSPEQIRAEPVDGRTDVYALGCIAHHMLTGRRAFAGTTFDALIAAHLFEAPPPLGDIEAPPSELAALDAMVARMLAKRPDERFLDMHAVLVAINAIGCRESSVPVSVDVPRRDAPVRTGTRVRVASVVIVAAAGLVAWRYAPVATDAPQDDRPTPAAVDAGPPTPAVVEPRDSAPTVAPRQAPDPIAAPPLEATPAVIDEVAKAAEGPPAGRRTAARPRPSATQPPAPISEAPTPVDPATAPDRTLSLEELKKAAPPDPFAE